MEREKFGRTETYETEEILVGADLLILDDLGAEFTTPFTTSAGTGITYNAGNEEKYYKMPYSSANENNLMLKNSFNPYFIKSELLNF